jgi:alkylated DNA nucleotide flippase Atl1
MTAERLLAAGRVVAASRLLRAGEWTTYGDLGAAATGCGHAARLAARLAASHPEFANAHRVLGSGGVVVRGPGGGEDARRARARLEAEGVVFRGRAADPARRVGWIELRGRLGELGELDAEQGPRGASQRPTA